MFDVLNRTQCFIFSTWLQHSHHFSFALFLHSFPSQSPSTTAPSPPVLQYSNFPCVRKIRHAGKLGIRQSDTHLTTSVVVKSCSDRRTYLIAEVANTCPLDPMLRTIIEATTTIRSVKKQTNKQKKKECINLGFFSLFFFNLSPEKTQQIQTKESTSKKKLLAEIW